MHPAKKNLIYLTGFMGSGKSTVAPILANTLGYSFLDIDKEIEKHVGRNVSEIFSDIGEEYFRTVECTLLKNASERHHCVISLGGGTIANDFNLSIVKRSGVLVYLKVGVDQIFRRLKYKTDRPLLTSELGQRLPEDELHQRIMMILHAREPYYNQADIILETSDDRVGITVDNIVRLISPLIEE